jgi:CHAT domain-containing protein
LGNNWLNLAKARIDFDTLALKVKYKHQMAKLSIYYERKNVALPKMRSYQQTYQLPVSLNNNKLEQSDQEQSDDSYDDDIEGTESEDEESSENDTEEEMTDDEKENQSLLVLEDGTKEEVIIKNFKESHIIQATTSVLTIPTNSSMTLTLDKPEKEKPHLIYHFETTHPKLNNASGYFDTCSTLIVNKRTVEI